MHVFSGLIREGWLQVSDLEGLDKDKIERIEEITRMMKSLEENEE